MDNKSSKQLIYGSGFLTVIFLILLAIYFVWVKPAPTCFDNKQNQNETGVDCGGVCPSCEIKTLVSFEKDWIKYFSVDNKAVIAAQIKNSNLNYGADNFSYVFEIYDKNKNKIKSIERNSFIYNLDVKYLFESTDINYSDIGNIDLIFSQINWKSKEELKKSKITVREKNTKISDSGRGIEVSGTIVSNNPFILSKIKIIGFLNNANGIKMSVSKTELENLEPFGERYFKIIFPINVSLISAETSSLFNVSLADPNRTEIYIEAR